MHTLKSKLSFSYAMVIVLAILLIIGLTNFFLDKHFREYVKQNQEQRNREIVSQLVVRFAHQGQWNEADLEAIGVSALESGLIIKVKDSNGRMLWDATQHNNGMCQRIIEQMAQNMNSRYPNVQGYYTEVPYPIYENLNKIGVVEIGSYGPYYMSSHDLSFINTLNTLLMGVGAFSLILALLVAHIMANRLSAPISKVITSAKSIEKGYFSDRVSNRTNTLEISQLTATINNLAETLEKQELLRKRMTGDLAHELRTPLATLQSHMEAMIDGLWEADKERLTSCHDEILRISRMVGDLEKLARFEGENVVLHKEFFDVTELITRLIQNFERDYQAKAMALKIVGTSEMIDADRDKISQVMVNLLSNAFKYTPQGGEVVVHIKGDEEHTEISVKDNGQGIRKEDLPFIFERFYRADRSRNRLTGGSGIGLTIAKAIIIAHKGTIEVKSTLDQGSEFIITLPKRKE